MNKTISQEQLLKLIPWFTESRYRNIQNSSLGTIYEELALRYFVKRALDIGEPDFELQSELFSEKNQATSNELIDYPDENVHPIHSYDIARMAKQLPQGSLDSGEHAYLHQFNDIIHSAFDGKGVCVGISLSHATDKEIGQELARLLTRLRSELDVPEPERPQAANGKKHRKLFSYGVFEYLDLTLWARVYGWKMTPKLITDAIAHKELITSDYLRKNTVPYAKEAMTFEYLEQFTANIKNMK
ncbi:DUF6387 family protein [uncultured Shewanella sp.]|uniref:DUF6387 family protein n=1 Tax=uncultured Shewanella sp. TaxID=173975 RepID=UPI002621A9E6|nr:DUF6387 family protein [uncultured Shewanella sp.]